MPEQNFLSLRESDANQHRYFLGDHLEGVPWGNAAHTLTPPRQHLLRDTEKWLPLHGDGFSHMESLAFGGLGAGWGAGSAVYTPVELQAAGFDPIVMGEAYEVISRRIGLAAEPDDATPYCGRGLSTVQPPLQMDASASALYEAYRRRRSKLKARKVVMGRMPMASLTRPLEDRRPNPYTDMEFWADHGCAVYRPWMTVESLLRRSNFQYVPGRFVTHFEERGDHVAVHARRLDTNERETLLARRLVLGTGALGSARIVMRSQPSLEERPLLTNGYCIAPCLHLRFLGRTLDRERTSLGQIEMFLDHWNNGLDVRMMSLYTYRSLLLFKLVKEVPLAFRDALPIMRTLVPALVLATINHPDHPSPGKRVRRVPDSQSPTGDALRVEYARTNDEISEDDQCERRLLAALRQLGCPALKCQKMPPGATIHYAGTLPFSNGETPGTIAGDGRLAGTRRVYIADGSGFRYLPANGLTLTIMAWAHVVARRLIEQGVDT
jgi:choline dehydrogenase-like flavoprotein